MPRRRRATAGKEEGMQSRRRANIVRSECRVIDLANAEKL